MDIEEILKKIYLPAADSHKGQNGSLLIIGGSKLFHAASLWALQVASRIVDLVHYSSVPEDNKLVAKLKKEFRNGIVIPRSEIENYIEEDDCILIGPGMVRAERIVSGIRYQVSGIKEIEKIKDEGMQTYLLTEYLLKKYAYKKWVIDAGALQMMEPEWAPPGTILSPHTREFMTIYLKSGLPKEKSTEEKIRLFSRKYNCLILLKGEKDQVVYKDRMITIPGGNAGMTKGGTGDVLAGLVASLYCKNDAWISAAAASFINKKAGEELFKKTGYWFNASDLANQIPQTMKRLFKDKLNKDSMRFAGILKIGSKKIYNKRSDLYDDYLLKKMGFNRKENKKDQ